MNARIIISTLDEVDPETGVETHGLIAYDDNGEVIIAVID